MQEGVTVQRVAKKHGLDGMKRILIFVGSITKKGVRKGHFDLLAAFKTYSNEDRESHLVFVGGGDALGDLERTSRNLNRVHVLGALPRQETMALIQYADLLILPSKEGESLGRVVLEAIELGTKVLCSDKIVEFRHLPSEYLLSALDSKTFSEKIGTALTCNKRIDYHFQDNSPEKITIKMRDLYHKNIYLQESVIEN
jgi:glycosyltransferase involved in cell wall biosynthesis